MTFNLKKEIPLIVIVAMPVIYLISIWSDLPDQVPLHWNIKGEIDRWGDKKELILLSILLPLLVYGIFVLVPIIDPKKQISKMGTKYQTFKFILTLFVSILTIFIIFTAKEQSFANSNFIFIAIGLLIAIFGNFLKTIRPNYFIGIRTPWTLENEVVWKETHLMAGKLWFSSGLAIVLFSMVLDKEIASQVFIGITIIIVVIPILFSYIKFKNLKK